ncbi:hypothetical protein IDJ77_00085 [Mucilaginibacter sp. ZT4R22]|uniref:DKNYY family protein n=1 Tax=Mucilaginibacter pankratovii TaxID=2772110 RepID=A0ABR7WIP9_9SPHI|nr:hypothetical protein [Mucilaginibacter pankratovii]MBD1362191.1 hypothetical protein [Mucilaginibacter pankratovii]
MTHLKLLFTVLSLSAFITTADAQFVQHRDYRPVPTLDYAELKGTPYLYEDWQQGSVKLANGVSSKDKMLVRYNLVNDMLSFKDNASGEEMAFVVPVEEFTINDNSGDRPVVRLFRSYQGIAGSTPSGFFEVLSDGKVQLIKKQSKLITESIHIGASGMTRSFNDKTKYYLVNNGNAVSVKNDKKSILAVLGDKQAQLEGYINANNINFKNDRQLGKLVDYYNTL